MTLLGCYTSSSDSTGATASSGSSGDASECAVSSSRLTTSLPSLNPSNAPLTPIDFEPRRLRGRFASVGSVYLIYVRCDEWE